jgi:hypothetical protein
MADDVYNNNLYTYSSTNSLSDLQNDTSLLKYDFLSCCEDTCTIWEDYFADSYPDFEYFVEELLYGNVDFYTNSEDYDGYISAEDYNTLKTYSEYYWAVYDDIVATYDIPTNTDVDALVWSLLKSTYYDEGFEPSTAKEVI